MRTSLAGRCPAHVESSESESESEGRERAREERKSEASVRTRDADAFGGILLGASGPWWFE